MALVILLLLTAAALPAQQATPAFRAETNLVLVPVVVRNAKGEAVANLTKDDFLLFDNGKEQTIASFAVEETSGQVAQDRSQPDAGAAAVPAANPAPMVIPEHYVALLFDDEHVKNCNPDPPPGYIGCIGDLWHSRDAAKKMIKTLKPTDRVGVFTSSGQVTLDFTADRAKIDEALMKLREGKPVLPTVPNSGLREREVENQTEEAIKFCGGVVKRMSHLPGQRTLVFISPGLKLHGDDWSSVGSTMYLIDNSIRARVVINSLDARGLTYERSGSFSEFQERVTDGTGGKYIRDTNDLNGAIERLAATPKYIYVLGFSPQDIKQDGSFHRLAVKLREGHNLDIQARAGYAAPDAKELARQKAKPASSTAATAVQVSEADTRQVEQALGIATVTRNSSPQPESAMPQPAGAAVAAAAQTNAKSEASLPSAEETKELAQALDIRTPVPPKNDEMTTTEQPATFKVQSNLVEVPVIVRDRAGHAIGNLKQEDFHIADKGKRQEITRFAIVKSAGQTAPAPDTKAAPSTPGAPAPAAAPSAPAVPTRFVAFVFDDVHLQFADLPQVRNAVLKYLSTSLSPQDRVALVTTSGKNSVDFTAKPEEVNAALLKIVPNPFAPSAMRTCMYVSYFQAVQIDQQVGLHPSMDDLPRSLPLRVAYFDASQCLHDADSRSIFNLALDEIRQADENGQRESQAALGGLKELVRRMAVLPGQRAIILVSPGFFVSSELQNANTELEALAIRSKVLINTIDARGVWTDPGFEASRRGAAPPPDIATFRRTDMNVAADELIALAEDTGGTVHMNNDFLEGVRKAAAAPEYLYILGFVPQDLKMDGSFHALKVTASSGEKLTLQARRGYWAPKHSEDEAAVSKQEIEDAVFSRDEMHSLPVDMHTQLSKSGEQSKLTVLTSVDLKLIHLRKAEDRNRNDLTIVAALFDTNGNFVAGTQKLLELRLRDETVARLEQKPPIVINTDFDVKPGGYLVRLVVRDAEGQQITAENAAVQVQ
jgi:VWFA-related protein